MKIHDRGGYTLMELVIAVLIIGIMASFAVPQYLRSIEGSKYDDAVALVNQIGLTNRMFALDHNGDYVAGPFPSEGSGVASCSCTATTCSSYTVTSQFKDGSGYACPLVCCNYLGDQDWSSRPYNYFACDPSSASGGTPCTWGSNPVSGASRATGSMPGTNISPYKNWGVWMDSSGNMYANPSSGSNAPPTPTY